VLITLNIALTLVVLIAATYLRKPTDLSTFPAIILFSTVFRLAITVASSRLILSEADAGEVIRTFGGFVISGKLLVGLIVFLIVAVVQFIVVVKGVERIAEVGARFTLDALPGKQMSIDSDLRNGDISKDEARSRRARLAEESQFFGAMDGAMRFVKGDAIAGFVIIFVNLIGGILVGMISRGMGFGEASRTYSLLTVGEGLVSQIPAMLVAIAAGIVVTRVVGESSTDLGSDIAAELIANRQSLVIAGGVLAVLGFLPGFPTLIFLSVAGLLVGTGLLNSVNWRFWQAPEPEPAVVAEAAAPVPVAAPAVEWAMAEPGDIFRIAVPSALAVTLRQHDLAARLAARADGIDRDLGFPLARAGLRIDDTLPAGTYRLDVEDVPVFTGHVAAGGGHDRRTSRSEAARLGVADKAYIDHRRSAGSSKPASTGTMPATAPPRPEIMDAAESACSARLERTLRRRNASAAFGFSEASRLADPAKHAPSPAGRTGATVPADVAPCRTVPSAARRGRLAVSRRGLCWRRWHTHLTIPHRM
jgi:type III secretion protein V